MQTARTLPGSIDHRFYSILLYLLLLMLYTALFIYAFYMLYTGMEKLQAFFNSLISAANDPLNYCFKK